MNHEWNRLMLSWSPEKQCQHASGNFSMCFKKDMFRVSPSYFACKPCIQLDLGLTNQMQSVELGPTCLWDGCHETTGIFGTVVNGLSIYHLFLLGYHLWLINSTSIDNYVTYLLLGTANQVLLHNIMQFMQAYPTAAIIDHGTRLGAHLNIKTVFRDIWNSIIKIKQSWDHLIFIMGAPIMIDGIFILRWAPGAIGPIQYINVLVPV